MLARQVDPGQTVAASFNTPTLFVIAEDLTRMKLEVAIDEADVGAVQPGQSASFTVDAFPGRTFPARISRVDLGSNLTVSAASASTTTTSASGQVVSYAADLTVANPTGQLRPGMTASVTFIVEDKRDALLVPNGALRFTPPDPKIAALAPAPAAGEGKGGRRRGGADEAPAEETKTGETKAETRTDAKASAADAKGDVKGDAKASAADAKGDAKAGDTKGDAKAGDTKADDTKAGDTKAAEPAADAKSDDPPRRRGPRAPSNQRTVWVLENGAPKPVQVTIGISDGTVTEIVGGELAEGAQIIVSASGGETAAPPPTGSSSPLNPSVKGARGGGGRKGM